MGIGQARQSLSEEREGMFVSAGSKGQSMELWEGLLTCVYGVWLGMGDGGQNLHL